MQNKNKSGVYRFTNKLNGPEIFNNIKYFLAINIIIS